MARDLLITGSIPTAVGTQTVVPAGASGVVLNVTSVSPSAAGFLSVRPADAPAGDPTTSNLNVTTGVPLPTAVTVSLPTTGADAGKVELFFGSSAGASTDILVDVVGYYTTTGLADLTARLPIVASDHRNQTNTITANVATMVNSVTITAPVAGTISIVGSAYFYGVVGSYKCNLSQGAGATYSADLSDTDRPLWIVTGAVNISCSTNGAISVTPGTYVINLIVTVPASSGVDDSSLEATFIAGGSVTVRPNAVSVEPPAGLGSEQG